jgi:GlpG protein
MRLLASYTDQRQGYLLSQYLKTQGIENQLDIITNTDWGSPDYGNTTSRVWVIDEDSVERASQIFDEFQADPANPKFQDKKTLFITEPLQNTLKEAPKKILEATAPVGAPPEPMGPITLYTLILCVMIYLVAAFTAPKFVEPPKHVPLVPVYSAPIYKELYFDYPEKYALVDELIGQYGVEKLQDPALLSPAGKTLYDKMLSTPFWQGYYEDIVAYFSTPPKEAKPQGPLFEKIRQGEIWRLFSPALLHSDILHLFFNMIWLAVLGKQMEQRLGGFRYILFILITGILCNLAQYFVSGPNFLGFSGILCAMLGFIWVRQRKAAWEGYILQDSTMGFILFFLITVAVIQIVSFYMEIHGKNSMGISIANTAHFTGLILGYLLGHINFFSWTTSK